MLVNRLRAIGRKLQLFPTPLHLTPSLRVFPLEFRESGKKLGPQKTRIMGLPGGEDNLTLSRFDTIPACDKQTDGQTSSLYQERVQYD